MMRCIGNNSRGKVCVGDIADRVYIDVTQHEFTAEFLMTPEEARELAEYLV